jgi:hypothetical protein
VNGRDTRALGNCHGFRVVAHDGTLGEVETPVFPPGWDEPDYLIVATQEGSGKVRRPVLPIGLVRDLDPARRVLYVQGARQELAHLPESLPLTGRGERLG